MWYFEDMIFANDTVDITNSTYAESTIVITDLMLSNGGTYACEINGMANALRSNRTATVAVIGGKINYIQEITSCLCTQYVLVMKNMTGPVKIDYVSTNYTEICFC